MKHYVLKQFDAQAVCGAKAWSSRVTFNQKDVTCKNCRKALETNQEEPARAYYSDTVLEQMWRKS